MTFARWLQIDRHRPDRCAFPVSAAQVVVSLAHLFSEKTAKFIYENSVKMQSSEGSQMNWRKDLSKNVEDEEDGRK